MGFEEGFALAKEINAIYKNVSAKSGEGIDELFQYIGKKIINPNLAIRDLLEEELTKEYEKNMHKLIAKNINKKLTKYVDF